MFLRNPSSTSSFSTSAPSMIESLERRTLLSGVSFASLISANVGGPPISLVAADFNGDGKLDVAANTYAGTVAVLLGNGDGTFATAQVFSDGLTNGSGGMATADFNDDGHPDLVLTNGSNQIAVLLGNSDGTFQVSQILNVSGNVASVAAIDVNGDGQPDLLTADDNGSVSVLLGNSNGTFQSPQNFQVFPNAGANRIAAAQFTGDGHVDLAVINSPYNSVSVLLGNGDGTFASPRTYTVSNSPAALTTAVLTGDGNADLIVVSAYGYASVLLGNGNGTFAAAQTTQVYSNAIAVATGDFNGDGIPDLVVTVESYSYGGSLGVLLGNGDGTFQSAYGFETGNYPLAVTAADVDGDGRADIVIADASDYSIGVLLNTANTLPSVAISAAGVVTGSGTTNADTATLSVASNELTVNINGDSRTFPSSSVTAINLSMIAGNDSVSIGAGVGAVNINGGGGGDTIVASNSQFNTLHGGAGPDSVSATSSALLDGGAGADTLIAGSGGSTLTGDDGPDSLLGGAGDDSLDGGAGADTLTAGTGADTLQGNLGRDSVVGGAGLDQLFGGVGGDTLRAGAGDNTLRGNGGSDSLRGNGGGNDLLAGGGNNDTLIGAIHDDIGIDILRGGIGDDSIDPGPQDVVSGSGNN